MKNNRKIIAMMLTLSMLAAAFAGCLGGDDEPEPEPEWSLTAAPDVNPVWVESGWDPIIPNLNAGEMCEAIISAMTKTDERDQAVDLTRAYYTSSQGVIGGSEIGRAYVRTPVTGESRMPSSASKKII